MLTKWKEELWLEMGVIRMLGLEERGGEGKHEIKKDFFFLRTPVASPLLFVCWCLKCQIYLS